MPISIWTIAFLTAGVTYALLETQYFTSSSYFIIKSGRNSAGGGLNQLASLAGFSFGNNNGNIDPSDYLDKVIQDQAFIDSLYYRRWSYKGGEIALEDILKIEKDTIVPNWMHLYRMAKINKVRHENLIGIVKDPKTGVLTLNSKMPDPKLACDLNNYILKYISNYIRNSIQTQAKEKRLFIEERIREVKIDLQNSENDLVRFKERNAMSNSPKVMVEEMRLTRQITINQEVYLQYQKQFELAKIEELDNQTLIQTVKSPEIPILRSSPNRRMIVIIAFLLGIFCGSVFVLISSLIYSYRSRSGLSFN